MSGVKNLQAQHCGYDGRERAGVKEEVMINCWANGEDIKYTVKDEAVRLETVHPTRRKSTASAEGRDERAISARWRDR